MYEAFRDALAGENEKVTPIWKKTVAGFGSGSIAILAATPAEVVKVKM